MSKNLTVRYEKRDTGARKFSVNGRPYASENGVLNLTDIRGKEDITITVVD